ncbi:DUF4132 domain-containing protein [Actinoallomurus sp. NBC_01490]|uniref:DUF4132 domain-containing protein n=1 Tax=Actinoallomurus sp. NBC_01490 TaxID=2903557 RepID=UPI002E365CEE|nr:DUF4132 domain-containing protein [Actinoallomurus sp. NBC_01490]
MRHTEVAEPAPGGDTLPDEETFEMPASWRRVARRRRGGPPRTPVTVDGGAAVRVAGWTERAAERTAQSLADPESDQALAEEMRAHLAGRVTPRAAALLAHVAAAPDDHERSAVDDHAAFADAWASAHGLAFAAAATAEIADTGLQVWWQGTARRERRWRLRAHPTGQHSFWRWPWQPVADRMRDLLADAPEEDYRAAVETLAAHRRTGVQRVLVSYLVPTETAWMDECCAEAASHRQAVLATMLFCSVGSAGQLAALTASSSLGYGQWSRRVLATLIEAAGVDPVVALMAGAFGAAYADDRQVGAEVLSRLPTDEAFGVLLDHRGEKHVQPALLDAMKRYPVRAVRLLAPAAVGSSKEAAAALDLLAGHVRDHPEAAAAALPALAAEARATVERLAAETADRAERVATAPAEALPPLLAAPPWTRPRKPARPIVIADLTPPDGSSIVWPDGRRDEWLRSASEYADHLVRSDWPDMIRRYRARELNFVEEEALFTLGPVDALRPYVADWTTPVHYYGAEQWMRPIIARFELDALRPTLGIVVGESPSVVGGLLLPFLDVRVARLMADWLVRLKSARKIATGWLAWHGLSTVPFLVPDAVGPAGRSRTGAEAALRHLASTHDAHAVVTAAKFHGDEAAAAVEAMLAADPLDSVPARLPKVGDWLEQRRLPQVLLRDRAQALPPEAAGHIVTMLTISMAGEPYAGLEVVRETCDRASLAEFGWAVFRQWRLAGMPAKDGWALAGLGRLGDDETVRRLTPIIRAWPGEGGHTRAVAGLEVLAGIGSEIALMHLNGIAQRVKFKALKDRAREKIEEVAEGLRLSPEQLADRLVPDFGLDDQGSMVLDYGPRRFVVGFDEQLKPYVLDETGKRRKDLPAPGARDDDKALGERKRFAALKKDVRTVAGDLIRRLETAMVTRRGWSTAEFADLFVGHPLTWHIARRLVWVGVGGAEFRIAEDRTLADRDDNTVPVPDGPIRIAHPLDLPGTLEAWSEVFGDYEILQPFPQLGRPVYTLTEEERAGSRLTRFEGATVPTRAVIGLERRGWLRESPQDAGIQGSISRPAGDGRYVVIFLDPGIAVGAPEMFPDTRLDSISLTDRPDGYGSRGSLRFGDLDPVTASEVIAELTELTA